MTDNSSQINIILDQKADNLLSGREIQFSEQVLDCFRNGYRCNSVIRPGDEDPLKLAVKEQVKFQSERLLEDEEYCEVF